MENLFKKIFRLYIGEKAHQRRAHILSGLEEASKGLAGKPADPLGQHLARLGHALLTHVRNL